MYNIIILLAKLTKLTKIDEILNTEVVNQPQLDLTTQKTTNPHQQLNYNKSYSTLQYTVQCFHK